jgi:acetyl esterase/lipase
LDREGRVEAAVSPGVELGDVRRRRQGETAGLVFDPSKLVAAGVHGIRATLKNGRGEILYQYYRSFVLVPELEKRTAALQKSLDLQPDQGSAAATTALFVLETVEEARRTYLTGALAGLAGYLHTKFRPERGFGEAMDFDGELRFASGLAEGLTNGRRPLGGVKGNLHLAYRSSFDGKLMPYRVFIPSGYDPSRTYPLAVLLHGSGGDENVFLGAAAGPLQEIAETRGYILAAPNGRGPVSGYAKENGAQQDVMDVVDLVRKNYSVDPARVYLTGHSMGGMGTWSIGLANRDRFAALAPMAGTRESPALDGALKSGGMIPVMITCGGKDPLMPAENCKSVADKAKALGYPVEYIVYPNDNHWMVVSSAMRGVFDFFDAHKKVSLKP